MPLENSYSASGIKLVSLLTSLLYHGATAAVSGRPELASESLNDPAGVCT